MSHKIKDQILTMLIEHSRIIYSVISDLGVYYTTWAEDYEANRDNLEKKKNKMQLSEEDGDVIKIRLIQDFAEAGTQGLGNYFSLILRMDNTINSALSFVETLSTIRDTSKINDEIKKRYHKLINNLIKMADNLKKTIKALRDNIKDVFKYTTIVHEIENEIDVIFREFLAYVYDNESLDIRLILKIKDSIMILEDLADQIHDLSDLIRVLIYE